MKNKKSNSVNTNMNKFKLLAAREDFSRDVETARKELKQISGNQKLIYNPLNKIASFEVLIEGKGVCIEATNYLREKTFTLLNKYKLPLNFNMSLAMYIVYNILNVPAHNFDIINFRDSKGKLLFFATRVFSSYHLTTKEKELRDKIEKKLAKKIFKDNPLRNPIRKLDRNLMILEKSKAKGNKMPDIVDPNILYEYNDREIAAEVYEDDCNEINIEKMTDNIRKIRSRTSKKAKDVTS